MLDELSLNLNAVEQHRRQADDNHFLVYLVNLSQWLQNPGENFVFNDLFLALLLNGEETNGSNDISENLLLFLMIKKIKEYF